MTKYLITIMLFISCNGYGQTKIVVPYCDTCEVLYIGKDRVLRWIRLKTYYKLYADTVFTGYTGTAVDIGYGSDSIYLYWKKYNYFKNKMSAAVDQMNRPGFPVMDIKIFRLADSCRKYKLLLDKIKK